MTAEVNRNILFIENNYSLAGSWKKFLELLFELDVEPVISVEEVAEDIKANKYAMIFIHLPFPEEQSVPLAEDIRKLEEEANGTRTPIYIFVLPRMEKIIKEKANGIATDVLSNSNMLFDAGNCILDDLKIQPKMKELHKVLAKHRRDPDGKLKEGD